MMKKWNIVINGKENEIEFIPNQWTGKHKLIINGKETQLKSSPFPAFVGTDQTVNIAGKECHLVIIGNKADLAIDSIYIDSQKPYVPLKGIPWWTWIFIAACIAVPIISLGGVLPTVAAMICSILCVRVSVTYNMKKSLKILSCFGITLMAWLLLALLMVISSLV